VLVASANLLDDALRTERNVDVWERLLLVRRVRVDNEQTAEGQCVNLLTFCPLDIIISRSESWCQMFIV
jgi:hypothetical protein